MFLTSNGTNNLFLVDPISHSNPATEALERLCMEPCTKMRKLNSTKRSPQHFSMTDILQHIPHAYSSEEQRASDEDSCDFPELPCFSSSFPPPIDNTSPKGIEDTELTAQHTITSFFPARSSGLYSTACPMDKRCLGLIRSGTIRPNKRTASTTDLSSLCRLYSR